MRAVRNLAIPLTILACASWTAAPPAGAACQQCDPFLHCVSSSLGARFCVQSPLTCALLLPCTGGPAREDGAGLDGTEDLTTFTLFEATSGASVQGARRSGAAPLVLGEEMREAAGSAAAALADAGIAFGRDFEGAFVDESGEGFSLHRTVEGALVRLEVRAMIADRPGTVLANEALAEGDQLRVPVRLDGRDRVLVLQTRRVPAPLARFDRMRLQRSLDVVGRMNAGRSQPLFKVHAL